MRRSLIFAMALMLCVVGCKKKEDYRIVPAVAVAAPAPPPPRPVAAPFTEMFAETSSTPTTRGWCINGYAWLINDHGMYQMFERRDTVNGSFSVPIACSGGYRFNIPK